MKWNNYILSSLVQVGSILGYGSSAFLLTLMKRKTQYISAAIMMAITQVILGFALIADVRSMIIHTVFYIQAYSKNCDLSFFNFTEF